MPRPLNQLTCEQIDNLLRDAGYTFQDLIDYCAGFTKSAPAAEPTPDKSDVDSKFVHATCEAIIASNCKLTRAGKEFVLQLRERASTYKSVRFSPKQWTWFNSIMLDAGVEALDAPSDPYLQR